MANWLNIVGLLFDMVGVIMLFFTVRSGFKKISIINNKIETDEDKMNKAIAHMPEMIRKEIFTLGRYVNFVFDEYDKTNKSIEKKTLKWFICIIIGFMFQLAANVIPLFN